ncbi:hypothetical protein D3C81_1685190 [compost metagenome]
MLLTQADVDLREADVEGREQLDDVEQVERRDHPHREAAAHLAGYRGDHRRNPPRGLHRQACLVQQCLAGGCYQHLPWPALEQASAQLLLQAGDLVAECRLHHVAALGSTGEVAFLGDGNGEFELLEVHDFNLVMRLQRS